jgi:mRNA interferase RelE/StbE
MIIEIQESAKKDLKKIDKSSALKLLQSMEKLKEYPNISNIKKLKEFYPPFRYRVGNYRVLFDIEDYKIIVFNIKHRSKAYE